ncbi:LamG domain-containing protein [Candidatus Peregrinibacteria bacterium]|nr:LamG domain-containing protein [Candidatus Peregrinibacteria bacterium]
MADYSKEAVIDVKFDPQLSKKTIFSLSGDAFLSKGRLWCDDNTADIAKLIDNPELFSWRMVVNPDSLTEKFWTTTGIVKSCSATAGTVTMDGFSIYVNGVLDDPIIAGEDNEIVGRATGSFTYTAIEIGSGLHGSVSVFQVFKTVINVNETLNKYEKKEFKEHLNTDNRILSVDGRDGIIGNRLEGDIVGSDLITNGGFDTDSDWTKGTGWTIVDGKAVSTASTANLVQDDSVISEDKTYIVTYTISDYAGGSVRVELGNDSAAGVERSSNGTFTEVLVASAAEFIQFDGRTAFTGKIDNVSVHEIIPAVTNTSVVSVRDGSIRANYYNGSTSKLDCGNYDDLTGEKSILAWVKPYSGGGNGAGRIFSNGKLEIIIAPSSLDGTNVYGLTSAGGGAWAETADNVITFFKWVLLGFSRESDGTTNVYLNGVLSGSADQASGTVAAGTTNILIGDRDADDRGFLGLEDQIRVENGLLTAQQHMQIFTSERGQYNV